MTPRTQTAAAIIILLAVMGIAFALVGTGGVSSEVFLPQPTPTVEATIAPSLTPLPAGSTGNWTEDTPGQLTYNDPAITARVTYGRQALADFAAASGLQPPAEDAKLPVLDVLGQLRTSLEQQITDLALKSEPDAFQGPDLQLMGGQPVGFLRVVLAPQTRASGEQFSGIDLVVALVDLGDGQVNAIQFVQQGEYSQQVYDDFRAWLEANAARLAEPQPTGTEAPPAGTEEAPAGTEAAPAATEAAPLGTEAAAATEQAAPAGTEVAPAATEQAAPAGTEVAQAAGTEAAPAGTEEAAPAATWTEIQPGMLVYSADPSVKAQITHEALSMADFLAASELEAPPADSENPLLDLMQQMRLKLQEQITQGGLTLPEDAFQGPEAEEIGGVPAVTLRLVIPISEQPAYPGLDLELVLLDISNDNIQVIQYASQGEPNAQLYGEYRTWLEDNIETLKAEVPAAPAPTGTEAAAPATEAPSGE